MFYSKSKWKWDFILCTGLDLLAFKWITENLSYTSAVPSLCGTKDQFHGRQFFHGWVGNGFGMIQTHCIYCAHYFYYHYISSMSDHQHQIHAIDCGKYHKVPDLGIMVWHVSFLLLLSCSVMSDPMDCSLPDSSIHGIILARILDWVATFSSRGTSQPRDQTCVSCIGRRILYFQATREVPTFISLYYMNIHCFSVLAAQQIYLKIWHLGPTLTDQESTALGTRHSCFLYSFLSGPVAQLRLRSKELQCDRLLANSVVFSPLILNVSHRRPPYQIRQQVFPYMILWCRENMFCFQAGGNCEPHEKCSFLHPLSLLKVSQSQ